MTTSTFLADHFGVTLAKAHDFVFAHAADPAFLFGMAKQFGVTSDMLSEIVGSGFSAGQVEQFFSAQGLNGAELHAPAAPAVLSDGFGALSDLFSLDTWAGSLSLASLRAGVIAATGQAAYDHAFDPSIYDGAGDGQFSVADLVLPNWARCPRSSRRSSRCSTAP